MVIDVSELSSLRKKFPNKRIVLGCGVFDLIHYGHVLYLHSLKQHGDIVVVAVRSDAGVKVNKGSTRPIVPDVDRVRMVDSIKGIEYTVVTPPTINAEGKDVGVLEVINSLQPDVLVTANENWEMVRHELPVPLIVSPRTSGHFTSTTELIAHIQGLPKEF